MSGAAHALEFVSRGRQVSALAADARAQGRGMDITQHGEEAYTNGEGALLVLETVEAQPVVRPAAVAAVGGVA